MVQRTLPQFVYPPEMPLLATETVRPQAGMSAREFTKTLITASATYGMRKGDTAYMSGDGTPRPVPQT